MEVMCAHKVIVRRSSNDLPFMCLGDRFIYLIVSHFTRGATTALVIAYNFSPLFLIFYMCARGLHKQTWGGWSWESLSEWGQYLKLGIPGLLMVCIEWWSFEVATFVTGSIDDTQLAINGILINLLAVVYQV